jgi:hypothetical protein
MDPQFIHGSMVTRRDLRDNSILEDLLSSSSVTKEDVAMSAVPSSLQHVRS